MIRHYINHVVQGNNLSQEEMTEAMEIMLGGHARLTQMAALLTALRLKGETAEEIAAAARVVRKHLPGIRIANGAVILDRDEINLDEETVTKTCSLDSSDTRIFNISTATALVAAGSGLKVAKFGARSESTFCGSANVVDELGINLDLTLTEVERCIRQVGLGFLYANLFHTALASAARVREDIGVRTIFNLIAPLINPARGESQVLGVYIPERSRLMARVLKLMECREAMVVYGQDTLDEFSITGPTLINHLKDGEISEYELVPEDVGLTRARPEDISGGDAAKNASIIKEVIEGASGPRRDVVLLNSAAALTVAGKSSDMKEGLDMARESIDSGRAGDTLNNLIEFTSNCGVYQHRDLSRG